MRKGDGLRVDGIESNEIHAVLVMRKRASPRQGTLGMVGDPKLHQVDFAVEELARCVAKCALAKLEILPIQCSAEMSTGNHKQRR